MNTTKVTDNSEVPSSALEFPSGRPLRLAIIGSGSLGLYYGVCFAEGGWDVSFLMRSDFAEAKASGIRLYGSDWQKQIPDPKVFLKTEDIGPVDCVFISLKATANPLLKTIVPPLLSSHTVAITIENGLGSEETLAEFIPPQHVLGAVAFGSFIRSAPAVSCVLGSCFTYIGEFSQKGITPRVETLVASLRKAGQEAKAVPDLMEERWRKLLWNIPFNGLAVTEKTSTDRLLADPSLLAECKILMQEITEAAKAQGYFIPPEYLDALMERTMHMGPYRPSTLVDFEAGRELEVEAIWGIPLRRAQAAGVNMPHLARLYQRLRELNPIAPNRSGEPPAKSYK